MTAFPIPTPGRRAWRLRRLAAAATILLLALAAPCAFALPGPTSTSFDRGAMFTVVGYTGSEALSGFPVLVRIAENSPVGFAYGDLHSPTNGEDLAFVRLDGAGLPYEIDTWDTNGTSLVWVRLPTMTNGTQFVMCWGSESSGKTVCNESPFSGYVGVWHMSEESGTVADSSGHSLTATPAGAAAATASIAVSGAIGNGRQCGTSTDASGCAYLSVPSYDSLNVGSTFAVSGWFTRSANQTADARIFSRKENYQDSNGWEVICKYMAENPPKSQISARGGASGNKVEKKLSGLLPASEWQHLFVIYNGASASVYLNGERIAGPGTVTASTDNGKALGIGAYSNNKGSQLVGSVDECRLLDAVPSEHWAKAEYDSMANAAFLTSGTAEPYGETDAPMAGVAVSDVGYTNATVTATVTSRGTGAASADVRVEVAASNDFASPLWTTNYTVATDNDVRTFAPTGLVFGTTYYARAVVSNDLDAVLTTPAASFMTQTPGSPAVSAAIGAGGFSAFSVTALPTDIGTGGEKVTIWLDVSAAGDFSDTVTFGGVETNAVPASVELSATGLANGTNYAARVRAVNVWGFSAISPTLSVTTRTEPVEMSTPTAAYAGEGVETLGIAAVDLEPGASYSVALSVGGTTVRTWSGLTETGEFSASWSGREGTSHTAIFRVSSSFDGRNWIREYRIPFTMGSTVTALADVSELDSMVLRVGDAISLPALGPGQSLAYDTNAVVSVDGTVFTALEPGACRVRIFSTDAVSGETSLSGSGVILVAPAVTDVKGGLFVNRTATLGTVNWCSASSWQKISGAEGHDWPDGPDDIALIYLPLVEYTVTFDLQNHDIVLGYLGAGSTHNANILYISNGGITFQTSDGSESWLRFSGRTGGNGELSFNAKVPITLANDLVLDGMGQDVMRATFNGPIHIGDHTLRTDRVPYYGGGDPFPRGQLQLIGDISGTGLFLHEADTTMRANGTKSFTGTWDIRNGRHTGNYGGCGMFLGGCHLAGATELAVRGAWMSDKNTRYGAAVRTGWGNSVQFAATTNYFVEVLPPKVTLDGGYLMLLTEGGMGTASSNPLKKPYEAYLATGIRDDWYVTDEFRIAGGPMGAFASQTTSNHPEQYPNSHSVFTNLVVERGGSASFALNHTLNKGEQFALVTNDFRIVNSPAAAWDSGKGYEILPFFFPNAESNNRNIAVRDTSTGFVTIVAPDSTASSTGNIRELGANGRNDSMQDGATWEAVTVYPWAYAYFAKTNSTVKILSGYLNVVAKPFAPVDHANSASSTVDFGDRPAYVYVNSQNETADIGCRIKGTGGFVKSAGGTLQLYRPMDALTGGVWVGCGRLSLLGDATLGTNDVFVAAGAKLRIACNADPFWTNARLDLEDRAWISTTSRIELDNPGTTNYVRRLYVNGVNRKRGIWGSSESVADFVDDALFSGPGVLKVKGDDLLQPALMILR